MRTLITKPAKGERARDASIVTVHLDVYAPADTPDTQPERTLFSSKPDGLRFVLGFTQHAEVLERAVLGLEPGAVADVVCTDVDAATDPILGITPPPLSDAAVAMVTEAQHKIFAAQAGSSIVPERNAECAREARAWRPPATMTRWRVRVDSVAPGVVPVDITQPRERLDWSAQQKRWAGELYGTGQHARARRRYKKALLDLEIPTQWDELSNIERNRMRVALQLNIALCALKCAAYDEAISQCERVLKTDPKNVKALFRRGCAHLKKPGHVNGLALGLEDLRRAHGLEPQNREVATKLAQARAQQKIVDKEQAATFGKMLQGGEVV